MESAPKNLVPNRVCGSCVACCKHLIVDTPELKKLPGILCNNCKDDGGCKIYETRPSVCRSWYCGWRVLPQLDESWRPDRSEILISLDPERRPAGFFGPALKVELIGSLEKIHWQPLVNFIATAVENKIPLFLSVPGPPGHAAGTTFLNDNLVQAVSSRNLQHMRMELTGAVEACVRHPKEAINLDGGQ